MVLEASNRMVPLMAVSFLRSLYSIFPDVGSSIIHLSFHFRSVSDRFSRGPWSRYLPDPDDSCRFTFSRLLSVSLTLGELPLVAMAGSGGVGGRARVLGCGGRLETTAAKGPVGEDGEGRGARPAGGGVQIDGKQIGRAHV